MSDLRRMLAAAAPLPGAPLDLTAVRLAVERRRRRRGLWWVGGVVALLTTTLGGAQTVLLATDAPETPRQIPGPGPEGWPTEEDPTLVQPAEEPSPRRDLAAGGATPAGAPNISETAAVPSIPTPETTSTTAPAAPSDPRYPNARSCAVDTRGLDRDASRSCRFTATEPGGATMVGNQTWMADEPPADGVVVVRRAGEVRWTWSTDTHGLQGGTACTGTRGIGCEPTPERFSDTPETFIEPGDLVEVTITRRGTSAEVITLGAGAGWECAPG